MTKICILMIAMAILLRALPSGAELYGVARGAAPVLNVSDITTVLGGKDGRTLKADRCGQVRELEFIALPGTVFTIVGEIRRGRSLIYRVETDDYPAPAGVSLYLDRRFVELRSTRPPERLREPPDRDVIVAALKAAIGSPYVWGGNVRRGIEELPGLFYSGSFSPADEKRLRLAGLDCSGLLYEATDGWSPRNTSGMLFWGRGVSVAGKGVGELAARLEPLDLIVWNGHVIIVLDRDTAIESRLECGRPGNGGVVTTPLRQRLTEIMTSRRPVDAWPVGGKQKDVFVVRRWLAP